ncbi:MAG TPA: DUF4388 domain-containing protein [Nitrolancea sp.]|jgi:hypothetical protein|nr:DUF4388 domain-containing protein [Nitrolancea sp.]
MALYGDLNDFALTDMLSMIARREKSGTLRLTTPTDRITLGFERGNVTSVGSSEINQHIGRLLIRHGYVREEQVEQGLVLQALSTPRRRLGEVLIDIGAVTRGQVADAVADQFKSSLVRLLIEPEGSFSFTSSESANAAVETASANPIDSVMRDALLLAEEWLASHPTRETVTISEGEIDPDALAELATSERALLMATLNGSSVLHTLALESALPIAEFDQCVAHLTALNLIRIDPHPVDAANAA